MSGRIEVWADGACRGNGKEVSIGGYGVVLIYEGHTKCLKGARFGTTNNAQEITAVTVGLQALTDHTKKVLVVSDSAYVINCMTQRWYRKWMYNGWKTAKGTPVENRYLWEALIKEVDSFNDISFQHVKGHAGIKYNEKADSLANEAMDELINN